LVATVLQIKVQDQLATIRAVINFAGATGLWVWIVVATGSESRCAIIPGQYGFAAIGADFESVVLMGAANGMTGASATRAATAITGFLVATVLQVEVQNQLATVRAIVDFTGQRGCGLGFTLNVLHNNPASNLYKRIGFEFVKVKDQVHEYELFID